MIEDYSSKLVDLSQLSQLTNDQSDIQILIPSITNEKLPKLAKKSYRMNPDGSRINISRKSASPYHQSPSSLSRRVIDRFIIFIQLLFLILHFYRDQTIRLPVHLIPINNYGQ